jgi:hypothetical protein
MPSTWITVVTSPALSLLLGAGSDDAAGAQHAQEEDEVSRGSGAPLESSVMTVLAVLCRPCWVGPVDVWRDPGYPGRV